MRHQRPSVQLNSRVCTAQLERLWEGLQPPEGYSVEIAVISRAYAPIIRKDTCEESLTKVMGGIICRISMTPHPQHLRNHRLLFFNKCTQLKHTKPLVCFYPVYCKVPFSSALRGSSKLWGCLDWDLNINLLTKNIPK